MGGGLRLRLARVFTELLAPSVVGVICPVAIGALSDSDAWRGAGLGLMGAVFAIGLPYAYIAWLIRTGGATDRHVSRREDRPKVLIAVLLCLTAGISVLVLLGAPSLLVWLLVGEVLLVLACLAISKFWKISMRSAVAAGTVTALVVVLGPWALLAGVAVALVSWGRVQPKDHTVGPRSSLAGRPQPTREKWAVALTHALQSRTARAGARGPGMGSLNPPPHRVHSLVVSGSGCIAGLLIE